jgi:hypothetical protein
MFPTRVNIVRKLRRMLRPAVVLALVLAQCVAAFGFPIVVREGNSVRACGCKVTGKSGGCCCGSGGCCASVAEPTPEPEPTCSKCCAKKPAPIAKKPVEVHWVVGIQAQQCHGSGPLGLFADITAIPPVVPARATFAPELRDFDSPIDLFATSHVSIPLDPPPRRS